MLGSGVGKRDLQDGRHPVVRPHRQHHRAGTLDRFAVAAQLPLRQQGLRDVGEVGHPRIVASRRRRGRNASADGMYIRMGAGAYVGRIGGLAVALGIGAAVFVGQGVASAEPSTTSGSASSSESRSGAASSENKQQHGEKSDTTTDSSDAKAAATESTPKKTKKSSASRQSTHEPNGKTEKAGTAAARTVRAATESVKTADETRKADAPKAAEEPAPPPT